MLNTHTHINKKKAQETHTHTQTFGNEITTKDKQLYRLNNILNYENYIRLNIIL